jgi:hypothetical protein
MVCLGAEGVPPAQCVRVVSDSLADLLLRPLLLCVCLRRALLLVTWTRMLLHSGCSHGQVGVLCMLCMLCHTSVSLRCQGRPDS